MRQEKTPRERMTLLGMAHASLVPISSEKWLQRIAESDERAACRAGDLIGLAVYSGMHAAAVGMLVHGQFVSLLSVFSDLMRDKYPDASKIAGDGASLIRLVAASAPDILMKGGKDVEKRIREFTSSSLNYSGEEDTVVWTIGLLVGQSFGYYKRVRQLFKCVSCDEPAVTCGCSVVESVNIGPGERFEIASYWHISISCAAYLHAMASLALQEESGQERKRLTDLMRKGGSGLHESRAMKEALGHYADWASQVFPVEHSALKFIAIESIAGES